MAGEERVTKLKIDNVKKVYQTRNGEMTALNGVNLDIKENEFICVVGPSGCGKSTLLNIIAGLTGNLKIEYKIKPLMTQDELWLKKYQEVKAFIIETHHRAGHTHAQIGKRAAALDHRAGGVLHHVGRGGQRRLLAKIQKQVLAIGQVQRHETAAADVPGFGVGHGQGKGNGDSRIHGIPAFNDNYL